jgi:hypothetical protein
MTKGFTTRSKRSKRREEPKDLDLVLARQRPHAFLLMSFHWGGSIGDPPAKNLGFFKQGDTELQLKVIRNLSRQNRLRSRLEFKTPMLGQMLKHSSKVTQGICRIMRSTKNIINPRPKNKPAWPDGKPSKSTTRVQINKGAFDRNPCKRKSNGGPSQTTS